MKKNISKCFVIFVCLTGFLLTGCMAKTEKLAELEKTQQQMQQEIDAIKKEADEAKQRAAQYEKLSDKYQTLVQNKNQELNKLQDTYTEIDKKDGTQVKAVKEVLKDKLIESAQDSIHLEKRLKRYTDQAKVYKEKSQQLEEQAKQTEESVQKTSQEIKQIKKEIVDEKKSQETKKNG
ncbi:hypothetical protein LO80_04395 [Candidatus Francisella endociliophora]|uniref:Lipoprotein n=1 Tax=Candidatus Francisella endociliophora TaxID=653937 RepID=A0A097ENY8_9GAMM|nr:hypothetical protein [Francisella sp. FSC1006]AIT09281.1 hypothetical protein LO80_04395 [Francisella sp. FSC1006]